MKFNKKALPKELQEIISANKEAYAISSEIENWVNKNKNSINVDVLLCWAHFEWLCASLTEFDEDYIDFGTATLHIIEQILELDPANEEALKNKVKIEKQIKKSRKAIDAILKYDTVDVYELNIGFAKELAHHHMEKASKGNKESAAKAYRIWERCYKEIPDSYEDNGFVKQVFYGNNLYYLGSMASAKFYEGGYKAAEPLITELIAWNNMEDIKLYDFQLSAAYWIKLSHLSDINDIHAFNKLFKDWKEKISSARPHENPRYTNTTILNPIVEWLLTKDAKSELHYILENNYGFLSKTVLTAKDKELMEKIKNVVNN